MQKFFQNRQMRELILKLFAEAYSIPVYDFKILYKLVNSLQNSENYKNIDFPVYSAISFIPCST